MLCPCFALQYFVSFLVLQSYAGEERELVALLLLCSECHVAVMVLGYTRGAIGWSAVCDWGTSWSYSLIFCSLLSITHLSLNEMVL